MSVRLLVSITLLVALAWPAKEVCGFFSRVVVDGVGIMNASYRRRRWIPGGQTPSVTPVAAARAAAAAIVPVDVGSSSGGGRLHRCLASATKMSESAEGVPAVVLSFGFTPQETLAAEEAVFRAGPVFPAGVRIVDGSRAATSDGGHWRRTTLRQVLADAMLEEHSTLVDAGGINSATITTTAAAVTDSTIASCFMPKLFLVLQSPTQVSPTEVEGGPGWLTLTVMEALDACEAVPSAIVSCVPPSLTSSSSLAAAPSSSSPDLTPLEFFDATLLDTPLSEVWRQEARRHFQENGLSEPLAVHHTEWCPSAQDVKVAMNLELDGAWVASATAPEGERWDTSKLVVLDGLVDEDLCQDLLDLVTEPGWATTSRSTNTPPTSMEIKSRDSNANDDAVRDGPPTPKWDRGLTDVEEEDKEEEEEEEDERGRGGGRGAGSGSWGLTADAMEWLCRDGEHPAIVELHSRLCKLYPEYAISHMPEAVMGASTARMVANAPVYGDSFSWHIDADPLAFPPSPWRDHFGTYTNREPGMPLFATLLLYLDRDWRREWDAETLFLDPVSDTGVFVRPRGGRVVIMDQDITHRISTPSQVAARPRYSLALKLVFFSPEHGRYPSPSSPSTRAAPSNADAAAPNRSSLPPPQQRPHAAGAPPQAPTSSAGPCISTLSGLRAKKRGEDWVRASNSVRFGSSFASSSLLSSGGGRAPSSSPQSQSPPPLPLMSTPPHEDGDTADPDGVGRGGDGSSIGGDIGVAIEEGLGVDSKARETFGSALSPSSTRSSPSRPSVEVRSVGVKGLGLFSTRSIAKGEVVAFYTGEILTAQQLDERYPDFEGSDYVMQLGPDRYVDARDPEKSNIARYANHSGNPNLAVELRPVDQGGEDAIAAGAAAGAVRIGSAGVSSGEGIALTTIRDVEEGEELTFDYGTEYFDGDDDEGSVIEDGRDMMNLLGGVDWGSDFSLSSP